MKKFLKFCSLFALIVIVGGVVGGCSKSGGGNNIDGVYRLVHSVAVDDNTFDVVSADSHEHDIYMRIKNLTIEIFRFTKSESDAQSLYLRTVIVKAKQSQMPTLNAQTDNDRTVYLDFSNLLGFTQKPIEYDVWRKANLPAYYQAPQLHNFGTYERTSENTRTQLVFEGRLVKTTFNSVGVQTSTAQFIYSGMNGSYFVYKNVANEADEVIFNFVESKLRIYSMQGDPVDYARV